MQKQKGGFSLFFLIFLISTRQVAWQGYGNMSSSNLTEIWTYINANIGSHTEYSSYDSFNTALSDRLNTLWDPAWNVFTIKTTAAYDTVLYGYAFRNHWMWFNNYQVNGVVLAFVIWKDYNCQGWLTVGKNGGTTGFADSLKTALQQDYAQTPYTRSSLWGGAKFIVDDIETNFGNAFSIVASQDTNSDFYGWICVVDSNLYYTRIDGLGDSAHRPFYAAEEPDNLWGNILIFQTR